MVVTELGRNRAANPFELMTKESAMYARKIEEVKCD